MSNKRSRDPLDDPKSGPSKNQLRGLAYVGQKPAFLQNALSALQGGTQRKQVQLGQDGRPAIPTRPDGEQEEEEQSEEDEWDLGRGDEAPTVVVLKEGKHLERDEVDRLRAEGEFCRTDPLERGSLKQMRLRQISQAKQMEPTLFQLPLTPRHQSQKVHSRSRQVRAKRMERLERDLAKLGKMS